jgi:hypothetical protein
MVWGYSQGLDSRQLILDVADPSYGGDVPGGNGVDFNLDAGYILGGGTAQTTDLGGLLGLNAQAMSYQPIDGPKSNEIRREFVFSRDDGGTDPTEVFVHAKLEGILQGDHGGQAHAKASLRIFDALGNPVDSVNFFEQVESNIGENLVEEVDDILGLTTTLIPGETYLLSGRMEVFAMCGGGLSAARALFADTFEFQLSGSPENPFARPSGVIPEPSTFLIWALGLLGLGCFVRRRRA